MGLVDFFRSLVSREAYIQRKVQKAKALLAKNKPLHAEGVLRGGLKSDPQNKELLATLLCAWILRGDPHKVREYCAELPQSEAAHFQFEMDTALSMQRNALRKDTFLRFLQAPPEGPERLRQLEHIRHNYPKWGRLSLLIVQERLAEGNVEKLSEGLGYLRDSNPELPLEEIRNYYFLRDQLVLDSHPDLRRTMIEASALRDPARKIRVLYPLASDYPDVALLQYDLGMAYFQNDQSKVAVRYLSRAVGINPFWLNGWIHLGFVSLIADRLVRAREAFVCAKWDRQMRWNLQLVHILNLMLRDYPSLPMLESGIQRYDMGDYLGARDAFLRALSVSPQLQSIRYLLGLSLYQTGEYKAAIDPLLEVFASEILKDNEEESVRLLNILERCIHYVTNILTRHGKLNDAMSLLDEVLMLNADFEVLQEDRKLLQQIYSGRLTREAYLSYQKAHRYQTHLIDNPLTVLSEALDECPDFLEAKLRRVVLLAEAGNVRDAIQELKALRSDEAAELVDFHLAGLSWQEGDVEKAREGWKQCVAQASNPWSQLAQANLDSLGSGSGHLQLISLPHSKKRTPLQQER